MITRDEALQCMNRLKNQLYLDGIINLTKHEESEKQFENTRDFVLDRYYKENNELTYYEKDYLLKYLLSYSNNGTKEKIIDRDGWEHTGYRLTIAQPILTLDEINLVRKAKKFYFPELFENSGDKEVR